MNDKLDVITDKLHQIDKTLQRNTDSLEHHIRRTDALEKDVKLRSEQAANDLKPIKAHVTFVNNMLKAIGALGSVVVFLRAMGWL